MRQAFLEKLQVLVTEQCDLIWERTWNRDHSYKLISQKITNVESRIEELAQQMRASGINVINLIGIYNPELSKSKPDVLIDQDETYGTAIIVADDWPPETPTELYAPKSAWRSHSET